MFLKKVQVDKKLQPGIRVTVKRIDLQNSHKLRGVVVSPETPRIEDGIYWGYQVRNATSFRKVIYGKFSLISPLLRPSSLSLGVQSLN